MSERTSEQILKDLYLDLNSHVLTHSLELCEFWYSDRLCLTFSEFEEMLAMANFELGLEESERNRVAQELITLESLIEEIEEWKYRQVSISEFLSKKSDQLKSPHQSNRMDLSKKGRKNANAQNINGASSDSLSGCDLNYQHRKDYLKEHTKKQLRDKLHLNNTLQNARNQSHYELTVKVGETNDICRKLKNGYSYILDTKSDQGWNLGIIENSKAETGKVLSPHIFERKYEAFKQAAMNFKDKLDESMEEDLKKALVEAMCLSNDLKKQIELLERKGITH